MIGIVVTDIASGKVISKEAYGGDVESVKLALVERAEKDKVNTYTLFEEDDIAAFEEIPMEQKKTAEQISWEGLGTVDEKLAFLGHKLGLE